MAHVQQGQLELEQQVGALGLLHGDLAYVINLFFALVGVLLPLAPPTPLLHARDGVRLRPTREQRAR